MLRDLGFRNQASSRSWRVYFPEYRGNEPGTCLSGARHKEGLTQQQLAKITGILQRHISEMENGKRTIGKKNTRISVNALKIEYRVLL